MRRAGKPETVVVALTRARRDPRSAPACPPSPPRGRERSMSVASAFGRLLVVLAAVGALVPPAVAGAPDPPRYRAYYKLFDRGPANVPGLNTSLVPQGLTY